MGFLDSGKEAPPAHVQQVYFSVCLSVSLSIHLSGISKNVVSNVGIKKRVSTWSHLSVVRPLRIPIPLCKKKNGVQRENLYHRKLLYLLS